MTSFTVCFSVVALTASLFSDWVVGRVVQYEAAYVLSRRGAYVSSQVPDGLEYLYDPYEANVVQRFGKDLMISMLSRIDEVWISDSDLDDEDLILLKCLPDLQYVEIDKNIERPGS